MTFIRDSLFTLISRLLQMASALIVLVVTTRLLGSEGRGVYALVILAVTVLKMTGSLGIEVGNVYFAGRDRIDISRLAGNSLFFSLAAGTVVLLLWILLSPFIRPAVLEDVPGTLMTVAMLALPFLLLQTTLSSLFLGRKDLIRYNAIQLAQPVLLAIVLAGFYVYRYNDIQMMIGTWTVLHVVVGIWSVALLGRHYPLKMTVSVPAAKSTVRYGVKAYLANMIQFLNYRIDFFLINRLLVLEEVGYYSISVSMAEILLHIPYAVGTVVFPYVSNVSEEKANRTTPEVFRHMLLLLMVTSAGFALCARLLFPLFFSDQFNAALAPFFILLPGVVALGTSKVIVNDLAGRGRPLINTIVSGAALVLNIAVNLVLIPVYGISGAALTSTITYTLSSIALLLIFKRVSGTGWRELVCIRKSDLTFYRRITDHLKKKKVR